MVQHQQVLPAHPQDLLRRSQPGGQEGGDHLRGLRQSQEGLRKFHQNHAVAGPALQRREDTGSKRVLRHPRHPQTAAARQPRRRGEERQPPGCLPPRGRHSLREVEAAQNRPGESLLRKHRMIRPRPAPPNHPVVFRLEDIGDCCCFCAGLLRQQQLVVLRVVMSKSGSQGFPPQEELPFQDRPTFDFPHQFFKTREKLGSGGSLVALGLKFHHIQRYQQDHLLWIIHLITQDIPRVKLTILQPNHLYGEVSIRLPQGSYDLAEYLSRERQLFSLLRTARTLLGNFIKVYLDAQYLLEEQFSAEKFCQIFKENVIEELKKEETKLFSNDLY